MAEKAQFTGVNEHFEAIFNAAEATQIVFQQPARRLVGSAIPCKGRSEEHTSELRHVAISYAVFCLKKKISDDRGSIVEPMNKVVMTVDVSHCGDGSTHDGVEVSEEPVVITNYDCGVIVHGHHG